MLIVIQTDHLYVSDHTLIVATDQILEEADLDTFTMTMVHKALVQKFPSLELDKRKQFIKHVVVNIIDPIAPQLT